MDFLEQICCARQQIIKAAKNVAHKQVLGIPEMTEYKLTKYIFDNDMEAKSKYKEGILDFVGSNIEKQEFRKSLMRIIMKEVLKRENLHTVDYWLGVRTLATKIHDSFGSRHTDHLYSQMRTFILEDKFSRDDSVAKVLPRFRAFFKLTSSSLGVRDLPTICRTVVMDLVNAGLLETIPKGKDWIKKPEPSKMCCFRRTTGTTGELEGSAEVYEDNECKDEKQLVQEDVGAGGTGKPKKEKEKATEGNAAPEYMWEDSDQCIMATISDFVSEMEQLISTPPLYSFHEALQPVGVNDCLLEKMSPKDGFEGKKFDIQKDGIQFNSGSKENLLQEISLFSAPSEVPRKRKLSLPRDRKRKLTLPRV